MESYNSQLEIKIQVEAEIFSNIHFLKQLLTKN